MKVITHLFLFMLFALASPAWAASQFQWPEGKRAAIVLTYDDALASQLDIAIPQLNKAGLKATFFLAGRFIRASDVERWREVARSGHELGNHSINHSCTGGGPAIPVQYRNESYSIEVMVNEAKTMNAFLGALDGASRHAYATPCGHHEVADGSFLPALSAADIAPFIRGAQLAPADPAPVDPVTLDRFDIPCLFFPESATAEELIGYLERVRRAGGLAVLGFHNVGLKHSFSAQAHERLLQHLSSLRSELWVAPLSEVMTYVTERRKGRH